jgi:ribosomal-protein-alanine N-acetyltransferase
MTPDEMAILHAGCFVSPPPWSAGAFKAPEAMLIGRVVAGEAELLTLAVDPRSRGQGIGTELVKRFLAEALQRKAESAFLEVAADNTAAKALYARSGFVTVGRRPAYYRLADGESVDALVMVCNILIP